MYIFYGYFPRRLFPLLLSFLPFYVYCVHLSRMLCPPGFYPYGYINRFFGVLSSEQVQPVGGFTSVWKLYKSGVSVLILCPPFSHIFRCLPQSVAPISQVAPPIQPPFPGFDDLGFSFDFLGLGQNLPIVNSKCLCFPL